MADDVPDLTAGVPLAQLTANELLAGKVGDTDVMLSLASRSPP